MTGTDGLSYRRSTFCGGGSCVEVAPLANGWVALRDSKDATKPAHTYSPEEWVDFVRGIKAGEFDFPTAKRVESATVRFSR